MRKDKEVHGLMKIPEEAVISELRIELGKAKCYIQELEEKIKLLSGREIKQQTFDCLSGRIKNLEKELEKSRKECNKVVAHNLRMQKQLFDERR
jgi:hypothetical protein